MGGTATLEGVLRPEPGEPEQSDGQHPHLRRLHRLPALVHFQLQEPDAGEVGPHVHGEEYPHQPGVQLRKVIHCFTRILSN